MKIITTSDIEEYRNKIRIGDIIRINVNLKDKDTEPDFFIPLSVTVTGVYRNFVTTNCMQCRTLRYGDILRGRT